jgi:anti-sigma factor RsiW
MTDHLSLVTLNALADGELSAEELAATQHHLASCPSCTSSALVHALLKTNTAKAGHRYAVPSGLEDRLKHLASNQASQPIPSDAPTVQPVRRKAPVPQIIWASIAALLLVAATALLSIKLNRPGTEVVSIEQTGQLDEVYDQHMATLAANLAPQVLSSDRHTVKPWFQGKLPYSFNLPENLPSDVKLDGANLTYLHNQPVAQLLYSIGRHRVSVFVSETASGNPSGQPRAERSGFNIERRNIGDLSLVAISDVESARLSSLIDTIAHVQAQPQSQPAH